MKYTFPYGEFRLISNRIPTLGRCSSRLNPQGDTVMRRTMTFRSTTDRKVLETLDKLIVDESYLPEQIFNMDETYLFWKGCLKGLSSLRRSSQCQVSRFV
jgi:hypothetical protein